MTEPDFKPCPRCDGCGRVADSDDAEPWSVWESLPPGSGLAVTSGIVKPVPCPKCNGAKVLPLVDDKTVVDCAAKFDNVANYGGAMPRVKLCYTCRRCSKRFERDGMFSALHILQTELPERFAACDCKGGVGDLTDSYTPQD